MFLKKRVYQGSSGRVYPIPFTDRIAEKPVDREWTAIWIENEFLRVLILPEIGGRIHAIQDKTNGYDLVYRQPVIKPALVGLAGPWISGGIEFNWPQHHRPATFLPVDFHVEEHDDGSRTVWCSDHDPMTRMKGMHGVCLHPGKAFVELKARACNRTPHVQTFLWWANVATRVHEAYQSFFPPDVTCVADHARRATTTFPLATGFYYGVNYGERARSGILPSEIPRQFIPLALKSEGPKSEVERESDACSRTSDFGSRISDLPLYPPNDLSFYANIPVPTSYMCIGSEGDFLGGYDYKARAGIIHIANHHISPGKKQWTWGNHEFGYAWDRNLTEPDVRGEYAPYIELMAGVYTDNQPDFSFLQPGETRVWTQYWYPIREIGPAQHANLNAAVALRITSGAERNGYRTAELGIVVTARRPRTRVTLEARGRVLARFTRDLSPDQPFLERIRLPHRIRETDLRVVVTASGEELISYQPKTRVPSAVAPATEPPAPEHISSADELFVTGLHLAQYRHATRCPTLYWREALRRDPLDSRCNNALGLWHLHRGEFSIAEKHFRNAIERLTRRNPNPYDGEPYYNLGLCLRHLDRLDEAYAAFYKATWNNAWAGAGYHALAEIDCCNKNWQTALEHLDRSLVFNADNLRARDLKVIVLRRLGQDEEANRLLRETLRLDPLDWWARHLNGEPLSCNLQTQLDIAHDYARAGLYSEAIELLSNATEFPTRKGAVAGNSLETHSHTGANDRARLLDQNWGAEPLVHYTLGWLATKARNSRVAATHFKRAAAAPPDYCFPARLEEIAILECAIRTNPADPRAPYYLGNLLYDRRRHEEAIRLWERSARLDPSFSIVWRNLGIGHFNIRKQPAKAAAAYERAFRANRRDELWKRLGRSPLQRLRELERHRELVRARDDLSVELCALYNQTGHHADARELIQSRNFQPWEGGEGGPLGQHVRSHLALGRKALAQGDPQAARELFETALRAPRNLGEAKHLLANQSDIHYWLGCAFSDLGNKAKAREHWRIAATFKGDFQEMSVRTFSEMTYYSALAWKKLGKRSRARKLLKELLAYALKLEKAEAQMDYFATSLPTMLLFEDDLQFRQETTALFLQAQAWLGLGDRSRARRLLDKVLKRDPNHAAAADLRREL